MSDSTPILPTAGQIENATKSVVLLLEGKDLGAILTSLPSILVSLYQMVVQFVSASEGSQQSLLLSILNQAISALKLPSVDLIVLNKVVATMVPEVIALLPKIEQGLLSGFVTAEKEAEVECVTCWGRIRALWLRK